MSALARVPWWIRFVLCLAIVLALQTYVVAYLGDWPWIAAAYTLPLPATLGVILSDRLRDRSAGRAEA